MTTFAHDDLDRLFEQTRPKVPAALSGGDDLDALFEQTRPQSADAPAVEPMRRVRVPGNVIDYPTKPLAFDAQGQSYDPSHVLPADLEQEQAQASARAQGAGQPGSLGRMGALVTGGVDQALREAGATWNNIRDEGLGSTMAAPFLGGTLQHQPEDYTGIMDPATREANQARSEGSTAAERFASGIASMPATFLDPKTIAAMTISHSPSSALGRAALNPIAEAAIARQIGPAGLEAVRAIGTSVTGGAGFGAAQAGIQNQNVIEGAAQGAVAGLPFAVPGLLGAMRGRVSPRGVEPQPGITEPGVGVTAPPDAVPQTAPEAGLRGIPDQALPPVDGAEPAPAQGILGNSENAPVGDVRQVDAAAPASRPIVQESPFPKEPPNVPETQLEVNQQGQPRDTGQAQGTPELQEQPRPGQADQPAATDAAEPFLLTDPTKLTIAELRFEITAAGDTPGGDGRTKLAERVAALRAEPDWAKGRPTKELRAQAREMGLRDRGTRGEVVQTLSDTRALNESQPASEQAVGAPHPAPTAEVRSGRQSPLANTESPTEAAIAPKSSPKSLPSQASPESTEATPPLPDDPQVSRARTDEPPGEEGSPETTGIAHRVSEAQGMEAPRGEGIGPEASVERGRKLLANGMDPEKVIADFNKDGLVNHDRMAVARAWEADLAKKSAAADEKYGHGSKQSDAAFKAWTDAKAAIKPMQTEWAKIGAAQQGETEIDTGTFHGLRAAFHEATGKDFTPRQAEFAKRRAADVQAKTAAVDAAAQKVLDLAKSAGEAEPHIKSLTERIVARLDKTAADALARFKARHTGATLRSGIDPADLADLSIYGAAKIAKGFTKFAEWSAEMVKDAGESIRPHLKQIWEGADKALDREIEAGSHRKDRESVRASITKAPVSMSGHVPGTKMSPERVRALWEKAKNDYIDKGVSNFDDITNKLATDLGLPVAEVRRGLAQPKGARQVTDDMYRAQAEQRRVIAEAKKWVMTADKSKWQNAIEGIPGAFFTAKVFGHGTVGMQTHAGPNIMDPRVASIYWKNEVRQYTLMASPALHEMMVQDLVRRPNYVTARRAGLANNPDMAMGDYERSTQGMLGRIGLAGQRGFTALKLFRQDYFDQVWDKLPESIKTDDYAKRLASDINAATGSSDFFGGKVGKAAGVVAFAPNLVASQWKFWLGDPIRTGKQILNWKNETPEGRAQAMRQIKQKAVIAGTYLAALAINQGLLTATGSEQKVNFGDPTKYDWLGFKLLGHDVNVIGSGLGAIRFLANVADLALGDKPKRDSRRGAIGHAGWNYIAGKVSPFAGTVLELAGQADYQGRPLPWSGDRVPAHLREHGIQKYGYGEYAAHALLPIPMEEAVKEALAGDGPTVKSVIKAIGAGAAASTGVRIREENR